MSIVMKFGGTSVADAAALDNVARIVAAHRLDGPVVVVSAMSGVTDALLASTRSASEGSPEEAMASLAETFRRHEQAAEELLPSPAGFLEYLNNASTQISELLTRAAAQPVNGRVVQDAIVSFGEMLSSRLLAEALAQRGVNAQQVDPRCCIITDDEYTCAAPLRSETWARSQQSLLPFLKDESVPVVGGFVGCTTTGITTTLGRGGSDYTAALLGAALRATEIQIWTDVTGVLTADPRVVPDAQTVERLSYSEAAELAYFGAKVLHPKTIQPAIEDSIPVRICNSRAPQARGTLVGPETETTPRTIKAIAHKTGVTTVQVTSARMLGAYGFLRAIFEVFERHRTVVDVVTTSEVSVSLSLDDDSTLPAVVGELEQLGTVRVEKGRAIICVVGEGLRGTPGIAGRVFSTISDINVTLISQGASSINFTFAIEETRVAEAVRRLHDAFFPNNR
ncbi:MAG TPA: lysine-sensitive aspartokinase 3 [Pyrinomonadaceae bacterium]|nr:lysine-sensitive aspartokinase 3 [Pyrinomonadaceae bacterium]